MALNGDRVEEIFRTCFFEDGEDTTGYIRAEGIQVTVGFHPGRIASHRDEIAALLAELPDAYRASGGGGGPFASAHTDRHGRQWTGFHLRIEQLIQLGLAIGKVEYCAPRAMWDMFPDGFPYFRVKDL